MKKEIQEKDYSMVILIVFFIIFAIGVIWSLKAIGQAYREPLNPVVYNDKGELRTDLERAEYLNSVDGNYIIILNDDQEAMPNVGGYLQVELIKGNKVYVHAVEKLE